MQQKNDRIFDHYPNCAHFSYKIFKNHQPQQYAEPYSVMQVKPTKILKHTHTKRYVPIIALWISGQTHLTRLDSAINKWITRTMAGRYFI